MSLILSTSSTNYWWFMFIHWISSTILIKSNLNSVFLVYRMHLSLNTLTCSYVFLARRWTCALYESWYATDDCKCVGQSGEPPVALQPISSITACRGLEILIFKSWVAQKDKSDKKYIKINCFNNQNLQVTFCLLNISDWHRNKMSLKRFGTV